MKYSYSPDVHDIQNYILTQLLTNEQGLRYAQMMPDKVDNDRYNYHLQYLVKQGLVQKQEDRYYLTPAGTKLMSNYDVVGESKKLFRVSVALYVFRNGEKGIEILRQKRLRHPYYGDVTGVAGKVHPGEEITAAATRKLKEETGLTAEFKKIGILRKTRFTDQKQLFEDSFYYICSSYQATGQLTSHNKHGENFWCSIPQALKYLKQNTDVGSQEAKIIQRLAENDVSPFLWEEEVKLTDS